jgi:AcrR family transcriptional regulator
MARPTTIDDEDILEAAREVFLARGIKATTAEVAERAGISEGTVFKRFRSKNQLFRAAMEEGMKAHGEWTNAFREQAGHGDVREQLAIMFHRAIEHLRVIIPLMMMSWSNPAAAQAHGFGGSKGQHTPPLDALRIITEYLEVEMRLGRVRRQDPEIVARAMMGAVWNFAHFEIILREAGQEPMPEETYVRGLLGLFWPGLEPKS